MILKREVLLRIQDLKQGTGRVAPEVHANLVDLVHHEYGVLGPGLTDGLDDAARERADVGAAMTPNLRFVAYAAE